MIEAANYALVFGNMLLLVVTLFSLFNMFEWKQIAMRRSGLIDQYEREVRELKSKNERLAMVIDALRKDDE